MFAVASLELEVSQETDKQQLALSSILHLYRVILQSSCVSEILYIKVTLLVSFYSLLLIKEPGHFSYCFLFNSSEFSQAFSK